MTIADIRLEIDLNNKKTGTFMNIPTKQLKQTIGIVSEPIMHIWNEEIILNKKISMKLKLADINPIFKKFENILVDNYRPVCILPHTALLW